MNGDVSNILGPIKAFGKSVVKYRAIGFFLLLAAIYGFIVYRIDTLSSVQADPTAISSATISQPHIDPTVVQKIQNLKDNSVSVQAFFSQARDNPFQE